MPPAPNIDDARGGPAQVQFLEQLRQLASSVKETDQIKTMILAQLGLADAEAAANSLSVGKTVDMLESIAYAGAVETQRLFADAMLKVCKHPANRRFLMTDPKGQNIFKRLLWCLRWDDK